MLSQTNTKLLISIPKFLLCIILVLKKYIYLCRTLSAHQRDGIGRKRFLFLNGVKTYYLSLSKT